MKNTLSFEKLASYIDASPTPYHAVDTVEKCLVSRGFLALEESEEWHLKKGEKYFLKRRDASILAFVYGQKPLPEHGIRMIGAHTDSPTLKLKPQPEVGKVSYKQFSIEVYGGALLYPWYDRDLSLAGMVTVKHKTERKLVRHLIDFKKPIATIPSLAIHLDRTANNGRKVNPQEEMKPIFFQDFDDKVHFQAFLFEGLELAGVDTQDIDIATFDLSFYDTQKAAKVGWKDPFFASARLDNLLSCFIGLEALLQSSGEQTVLLALHDHEEVGSRSHTGADGNMLQAFLERLCPEPQQRHRVMSQSVFVSADNAHGVHPNFAQKHDANHGPLLNKGPVIKVDANQSYATTPELGALFMQFAEDAGIPLQSFVTRADMRCGSTIGPMSSAKLGIKTIDLGLATFAMHSVRELAGLADIHYLLKLLKIYSESDYLKA